MASVQVRNLEIGSGIPKVCVPIVGQTSEDILNQAKNITSLKADLVEWRVDWYDDVFENSESESADSLNCKALSDMLANLREVLGEMPLLVTFRTAKEGGEKDISKKDYESLCGLVSESGYADLIDVELFTGDKTVKRIIKKAHENNVAVIVSNHDFEATPDKDEIINRLVKMQKLGADIPKIAVMPKDEKDVLTLLSATEKMSRKHSKTPIVTMSMSGMGVVSRICGEAFGSAITFGAAEKASAPGQINAAKLVKILKLLHDAK